MASPNISTRFLVLSDTHGEDFPAELKPHTPVDVAIHCGDLTEHSKIEEFKTTLRLMKEVNASLKLVIAGNHDWTLDIPIFHNKVADTARIIDSEEIKKTFGDFGEARQLIDDAKNDGITFLDEGTHKFKLDNGALLTVYASPFTPSEGDWGFQYRPADDHQWSICQGVDIAITHGPPKGVFDMTHSKQRAGSPSLFAAIARARPKMHCFGHIHEGWGAKMVTWRDEPTAEPSHFTDINNDESTVIENLSTIHPGKFDSPEDIEEKQRKLYSYGQQTYCDSKRAPEAGTQTLFVNAAIKGDEPQQQQLPWIVNIDLPVCPPGPSD